MPDLRQLRTFIVVAEELNFTRAAERLFTAQQAVSRTVAGLEREVGVTLLNRTTHEVTLTPAGAALLKSGRQVIVAVDRAFSEVAAIGEGRIGAVRIGATPAVGGSVRAQIARYLRASSPALDIDFREVRPSELTQLLRDRRLEVVLSRSVPEDAELDSTALAPTQATLMVPADHPLADAETVSLADLDGERLLTWNSPGTPFTDMLLDRIAAAGAKVEPVQARVLGGQEPPGLSDAQAVAILPRGWPAGEDAVEVEMSEPVDLPLLAIWLVGESTLIVDRLREALAQSD